jgi:CRISPR-associated protein (TIGR03986 family)
MAKKKSAKRKGTAKSSQKKSQTPRSSSDSGYRFLNPYNFVRFLGKGKEDPDDPEVTLLGRCAPPPHDRYVGISGRITCTLETVTPLFISDSEGVCEEPNDHKGYRFFQVNSQYAIPATALRGMVRSVFEAVTNSCMTIFEGTRQSYHLDSKLAPQLVPARVEKDGDRWLLRLLTGTTPLSVGTTPQGSQYAAWIYRYWPMKPSGTLRQDPPQNNRVRQFQRRTAQGNEVNVHSLKHGEECYALLRLMQHPHPQIQFWDVIELSKNRGQLEGKKRPNERVEKGWICITNQNIEPKHSERFFFRAAENNGHPETIELPEKVRQEYVDLIRDYQDRHGKTVKWHRDHSQPLDTPIGDEPGLSRFIYTEVERELRGGELVYAMLEGEVNQPRVKFIVPVSVPRVAYENSIAQLLLARHSHLSPCTDYSTLCPACRVFGWVHQQAPEDPNVRVAYAGRVSFSHGILQGQPKKINESIPLAILSSPKPTTTAFYLLGANEQPSFDVTYDTSGARLRGRKFYRHHGTANPEEYRRAGYRRDGQNRTVRDVLDSGNKFTFTVHFENLAPVELGALLWALELEEGWVHRLGFAKPLGFGSVKVSVDTVEVLNPGERYTSLTTSGWHKVERGLWQQQCVEKFKAAMQRRYNKAFDELKNVQDLKALLGTAPTIQVHYPRPPYNATTKPDPEGKQYEWFMGNKKKKLALKLAPDDTEGLLLINKNGNEF